jgi:hypothetical protein
MNALKNIPGFRGKLLALLALTLIVGLSAAQPARADAPPLPTLYLLSVGINNYQYIPKTNACAKDAEDVAALFQAQQGKMFGKVETKVLLNADATAHNIKRGLQWLNEKADGNSYVIVFFAGHGNKTPQGEYFYNGYDSHLQVPGTIVLWRHMQTALDGLPSKTILMLNSCFSGAVGSTKNLTVLSSSLGSQVSFERPRPDGNGYFSLALLEALSGKADVNGDGTVTLAELNDYIAYRVNAISYGKQITSTTWPSGALSGETPMAHVNAKATAKLGLGLGW